MLGMLRKRRAVVWTRASVGTRLFAFGYEDFASLLGISEAALRKRVDRGSIDLTDLKAVLRSIRLDQKDGE